jgi:hypothetical protein
MPDGINYKRIAFVGSQAREGSPAGGSAYGDQGCSFVLFVYFGIFQNFVPMCLCIFVTVLKSCGPWPQNLFPLRDCICFEFRNMQHILVIQIVLG